MYLIMKGWKYANLIEIQFYMNQIKALVPEWTDKQQEDFFKDAKTHLKLQPKIDARAGLLEFAETYLNLINEPKLNPSPSLTPI